MAERKTHQRDAKQSSPQETTETLPIEETEKTTPDKESFVKRTSEDSIEIHDIPYEIKENHRDAFDPNELNRRYSDLLDKYDYIVADVSDGKARLKGFYRDEYRKAPAELRISFLEDYLTEYCNFGCPYYVLARTDGKKGIFTKPKKSKGKSPNRKKTEKSPAKSKRTRQSKQSGNRKPSADKKPSFETKEVNRTEKLPSHEQSKRVKTVKDNKGKPRFHIRKKDTGE